MKSSTCACGCGNQPMGDQGTLERPRYFPRQLITPVELTLEQQYFRDRLRRHNRLIHGWGVVCGAAVCQVVDDATQELRPWVVRVHPGYLLGPYGDEIVIAREEVVDLRTPGVFGACDGSPAAADPWCTEVKVQRPPGPLFVAVRYREAMSRPVRVQPVGCGCDDAQCECSRWQDGYEIGILASCPAGYDQPPSFENLFHGAPPALCPDCPGDGWVALARVDFDDQGTIQAIDNCSCRRLVVSWASLWWKCQETRVEIGDVAVAPDAPAPGTPITVTVKAKQLPPKVGVSLGSGVVVSDVQVDSSGQSLTAKAKIAADASPGPRTLRLTDPNGCVLASKDGALTVAAPAQPAAPANTPTGDQVTKKKLDKVAKQDK
jgi:hypothetical protein